MEEVFLDPGFYWSWERFEDRWLNYFGYMEEDLGHTVVDVMAIYDTLVCGNLQEFMEETQFIKVCEFFSLDRDQEKGDERREQENGPARRS